MSSSGDMPEARVPSDSPASVPDAPARLFTLLAWLGLSAGLFWYTWSYGANVPWPDDWPLVPVLSHAQPLRLGWLWMQQNEHRLPVTKLILFGLGDLTGGDYRAGLMATSLVLSLLALASIEVCRRVRRRSSYADAFFPLVLLHWGHQQNLLQQIQLFFAGASALGCAVGLFVSSGRWASRRVTAAALGACLILLPLHGGIGLVLTPGLALWALYAAWRQRPSGSAAPDRGPRAILAACALLALALTGAYFIDFVRPAGHTSPSITASLRSAFEVLSIAVGPAGADAWPLSALAVALLAAGTLGFLLYRLRSDPADHVRTLGLLVGVVSALGVAIVIGVGRAGFGPEQGFEARYSIAAVILLCWTYLAWTVSDRGSSQLVQMLLFTSSCLALVPNLASGRDYGRRRRAEADALEQDIAARVPPAIIAERHWLWFHPQTDLFAEGLEILRRANRGPYRALRRAALVPERCGAWIPGPQLPSDVHNLLWQEHTGKVLDSDPYAIFSISPARHLCAVRATVKLARAASGPTVIKTFWANSAKGWFTESLHWRTVVPAAAEPQVVTVWINQRVDLVRFDPDAGVVTFELVGLELLPHR